MSKSDLSQKQTRVIPLGWTLAENYQKPTEVDPTGAWKWKPHSEKALIEMSGIETQTGTGSPMYSDDRDRDS